MKEVLYRKYRPTNFDEIKGQEPIKKTLLRSIQNGNIAHAYLFSGPRGTGKTSIARIFAREVNGIKAQNNDSEMDIIEIDAASNRGIEEVRELRQKINFAPSSLKYKVYIIDEVHMLTKEAFNALLKTLEEPPAHVIFILATTEIHKVPVTVLSRTQRFDFKLASKGEIKDKLNVILDSEGVKIKEDGLDLIIKLGRGSFRDTETILEKVLNSKESNEIKDKDIQEILGLSGLDLIEDYLESILGGDSEKSFKLIEDIENASVNMNYFYTQLLESLRQLLIRSNLKNPSIDIKSGTIVKLISTYIEASRQLKFSPIEILTLEIATSQALDLIGRNGGSQSKVVQSGRTNVTEMKLNKIENEELRIENEKKRDSEDRQQFKSEKLKVKSESIHIKKEDVKSKKEEKIENRKVESSEVEKEMNNEELKKKNERNENLVDAVGSSDISFHQIEDNWNEFLDNLNDINFHLVAFLKQAKLTDLKEDTLTIEVGYKFHKSRIDNQKSKDSLRKAFSKTFGAPILIDCIVNENIKDEINIRPPAENPIDTNEDIVEEIFGE